MVLVLAVLLIVGITFLSEAYLARERMPARMARE